MKISFDLDGTVCDSDWGWLDSLKRRNWPKDEEDKYYACREKVLDPYQFLGVDDEAVILTGRPVHLKDVTLKWLNKNGLGNFPVVFTKTLKKHPNATKEEFLKIGVDKALYCLANNISVHFEDNEQVVFAMRKLMKEKEHPTRIIHTGWHVSW